MEKQFVEYAPLIVVVLAFIWQNNVFVKPEQLEQKHREILLDLDIKFKELPKLYVTLPAYLSFREQVLDDLKEVKEGIDYIKNLLIHKDDWFWLYQIEKNIQRC